MRQEQRASLFAGRRPVEVAARDLPCAASARAIAAVHRAPSQPSRALAVAIAMALPLAAAGGMARAATEGRAGEAEVINASADAALDPEDTAGIAAGPAPSRMPPRPLAWALDRLSATGDWDAARQIAQRDGPAAEALIEWYRLSEGLGDATEVLAFLDRHPDWPGLDRIRARNEEAFAEAPPEVVTAFFAGGKPATVDGVILLSDALRAEGKEAAADAVLVDAWQTLSLSEGEQTRLLDGNEDLLKPYHARRLEMLFWRGLGAERDRMEPLVDDDQWALVEARRLARAGASGAQDAIDALPDAQKADPALAYGRFRAMLENGRTSDARELMEAQSLIEGGLGRGDEWANERRAWARQAMRDGDVEEAYRLAANHQLSEGGNFADLEWLSGYLALRFLDQPGTALDHFEAMKARVSSAISLGRANYWIGRANEAMGRTADAQAAYEEGGQYQTAFYGLLSAEKAGMPFDQSLAGADPVPEGANGEGAELLREAGTLMVAVGRGAAAGPFMTSIARDQGTAALARMGAMFEAQGDAYMQVRLGKSAAMEGIVLPRYYYAMHPLAQMPLPVAPELALAIARRESEFSVGAQSHVGAGGLMQLMPATASEVAARLGISHSQNKLMTDWEHNATLGSAYLAELGERFWGNVLLMSAGYNAGPGRPIQWMEAYGDPRTDQTDVVDWIEFIPFRETQNYVQRVAESLPVYRARLGLDPLPIPFSEELKGSTLMPLAPEREEARAND